MQKIVVICLLLMPAVLFAQTDPLSKAEWKEVITKTNFSEETSQVEQQLQYGNWYSGLLLYKDGSVKETTICITSFYHLSQQKGRLKTTNYGQVSKSELSRFVIGDYMWANKAGIWGIVQMKGPLCSMIAYQEDETPSIYLIDEQGNWATESDIASGFRKKMKLLIGDHLLLAQKIDEKASGYRYSAENFANIINEYNEWIRVNDPNRYQKAIQLLAHR